MNQSLECPRCRRPVGCDEAVRGPGRGRCPVCNTELSDAAGPKEAEVRKYLYSHRLLPLAPLGGAEKLGSR